MAYPKQAFKFFYEDGSQQGGYTLDWIASRDGKYEADSDAIYAAGGDQWNALQTLPTLLPGDPFAGDVLFSSP